MPENETYSVFSIVGFILIILSFVLLIDVIIIQTMCLEYATGDFLILIPLGTSFIGVNMFFIFGLMSLMNFGK